MYHFLDSAPAWLPKASGLGNLTYHFRAFIIKTESRDFDQNLHRRFHYQHFICWMFIYLLFLNVPWVVGSLLSTKFKLVECTPPIRKGFFYFIYLFILFLFYFFWGGDPWGFLFTSVPCVEELDSLLKMGPGPFCCLFRDAFFTAQMRDTL